MCRSIVSKGPWLGETWGLGSASLDGIAFQVFLKSLYKDEISDNKSLSHQTFWNLNIYQKCMDMTYLICYDWNLWITLVIRMFSGCFVPEFKSSPSSQGRAHEYLPVGGWTILASPSNLPATWVKRGRGQNSISNSFLWTRASFFIFFSQFSHELQASIESLISLLLHVWTSNEQFWEPQQFQGTCNNLSEKIMVGMHALRHEATIGSLKCLASKSLSKSCVFVRWKRWWLSFESGKDCGQRSFFWV